MKPTRRIDVASLALLLVGLASWALCWWVVAAHPLLFPFVFVPSMIAMLTGAAHLLKYEAPRE